MTLNEKLMKIQVELKAPKNLFNKFGNYKYRNAEGICEAVKPYLQQYNVNLILRDSIDDVAGRVYVKATATLYDCESDSHVEAFAYAREAEMKKGMDESQITGTASSYARKYALNGLFLLDDTKDADTDEFAEQTKGQKTPKFTPATASQIHKINEFISAYAGMCESVSESAVWNELKSKYGFSKQSEISKDLADKLIKQVELWYKKKKEADA
ncbi:ERF family protein [Agathobacter rectalis]|jgi:hypothetical protein|uniref:ERF family protein n=1 Tax=Agathobacter rectalis TaxID=39491 RepID=UPI0034A4F3A7